MRALVLLSVLLIMAGCAQQDSAVSPTDTDLISLDATIQGQPVFTWAGIVSTSFCTIEPLHEVHCDHSTPNKKITIQAKHRHGFRPPVTKGRVVFWACTNPDGSLGSAYDCGFGDGRYKRYSAVSIIEGGYADLEFVGPAVDEEWRFEWKYFAQGSGGKNTDRHYFKVMGVP